MKSLSYYLKSATEILLYAYIWQIPFSWRIVIDPNRSQWSYGFNEYMDISLYVGEVFIAFALLTHILGYKNKYKSIVQFLKENWNRLFHVEQRVSFLALGLLLVSINLVLSIDPFLSLVSLFHFLSIVIFMFLFLTTYVSRGTSFIINVFYILQFSLVVQFFVGFSQVLSSASIGITFLNESKLSLGMENVAKSNIYSTTYLRAYGTFLHPNILSAFAILTTVISMYVFRLNMFHVKHYIKISIFLLSGSVIFLAQSKIALIVYFLIIAWYINDQYKLFHVKHYLKLTALVIVSSIIFLVLFNIDAKQSFLTRIDQFNAQISNTNKGVLIGSGFGTYRLGYDIEQIKWWNQEPVHFVPFIAFKELGLIVCAWLIVCLWYAAMSVSRGTIYRCISALVFITYVVMTDHFFWDIYQGTAFSVIAILILYIDIRHDLFHNMNIGVIMKRKAFSE